MADQSGFHRSLEKGVTLNSSSPMEVLKVTPQKPLPMKTRILLVEDDPNLSEVLSDYLEMMNYEVFCADDGEKGFQAFRQQNFDLCILDVMLPKTDGFTLAGKIRKINQSVPIIFLTARGSTEDRVTGFKAGCDDYIAKPFSSEELNLRIEAILRRCTPQGQQSGTYAIGKYIFDYRNLELLSPETKITLTQKEASLLRVLCRNMDQLVTRETALTEVWGGDDYFSGRSMDVFITKLRKYLKDDPHVAIVNIHGSGFKLEVSAK